MGHHYLNQLFAPSSIAVFGASEKENSVAALVYHNLTTQKFKGKIYAINPKYKEVKGTPCYKHLDELSKSVDLAVIATPASTVPSIIRQCGEHGVKGALIMSSGFASDGGSRGIKLEQEVLELARRYNMHIIGPNCMGIMRPRNGLNTMYSHNTANVGKIALVSQSGAVSTAILDWAKQRQIGFSSVINIGDAADVKFGDVLDFLALDPYTTSILLYIDHIESARRFMSGIRSASRMKPVVVLKAASAKEPITTPHSHTRAIVSQEDAFHAALERAGVVRVNSITQLFSAAEILDSGKRVQHNRLLIISNGIGPGIIATDHAVKKGLRIADLKESTIQELDTFLPSTWSQGNPVDLRGSATAEQYEKTLTLCLKDENLDAILVMLTPQAQTDAKLIAETIIKLAKKSRKPILTCWMGGDQLAESRQLLFEAHIPTFEAPEHAIAAFSYLADYRSNQKMLMQVPPSVRDQDSAPDVEGARLIIASVLAEGRRTLSTTESRAILSAFHIPSVTTFLTRNPAEALVAAETVGFPVVMKISSPDVIHKSDVNGVRLNVSNAHSVRSIYQELISDAQRLRPDIKIDGITVEPMYISQSARELMIGVVRDPIFGPVISFGTGGTAVEVHRDRAVVLPPLNNYMIKKTIYRTRAAKLLEAFRNNEAINMDALITVMQRISEMVCELPEIMEMDINPLMADERGVVAVDAQFRIAYPPSSTNRYDHMAIHPYPNALVKKKQLADGTDILIRPIRPEDAEIVQDFVRNLSQESRYMRFMQALRELTPDMLVKLTQIDYDRDMAFVALSQQGDEVSKIGIVRYSINPDHTSCEFALAISDQWQNRGLGRLLMNTIMDMARDRGLRTIEGEVLSNNSNMLRLMKNIGFERQISAMEDGVVIVTKHLSSTW